MNRKRIITNNLLIDNSGLVLLKSNKVFGKQLDFTSDYFTYEVLNDENLKNSFYKKIQKGHTALLIPASQLFIESFFIPKDGRSKLKEIIKVKFINLLPLDEKELYYSYYIDEKNYNNSFLVICYAVKKETIDRIYNLLIGGKYRLKYIIPLPVLLYLYHYNQNRGKIKSIYQMEKEEPNKKQALIFIDRYYNKFPFTVFHSKGVYFRSANLENFKSELDRTIDYFKEYLKNDELLIYSSKGEDFIIDNNDAQNLQDSFMNISQEFKKIDLSSLNLISQLPNKKRKKLNIYRVITALLLILILITNILIFNNYLKRKNDRLVFNQEQLQALEPKLEELLKLEEKITIGEIRQENYKKILGNKRSYLDCLYELSKELPEGTVINHLSLERDRLVLLDGIAPSAAKVMEALQDNSMFGNLEFIGGIVIAQEGERFRIAGDLIND